MIKKSSTQPSIRTTMLSNGMTLENFINNYGNFGPDSFYEGKQFMKLLQEAEREATKLGGYVLQEFYETISGKQATLHSRTARLTIERLHADIELYREKIWDMTPPEEQFMLLLQRHDWYYSYSDDNGVWRQGEASWNKIQDMLKEHPEFNSILEGFKKERNL